MSGRSEKTRRLEKDGALHPHPENVRSKLVAQFDFFDANDLVQMKYEMLRSVDIDKLSITDAAAAFGLSRVAFYRARRQYKEQGLPGLLAQKRGPKRPHKLTDAIISFVQERLAGQTGAPDWRLLSQQIEERFGTVIHPRSVERAVKKAKKGGAR